MLSTGAGFVVLSHHRLLIIESMVCAYVIRLWLVPCQPNNNNNSNINSSKQTTVHRDGPLQTLHCTDFVPEPGDHIQDLVSRINKKIQHKHIKGRQMTVINVKKLQFNQVLTATCIQ